MLEKAYADFITTQFHNYEYTWKTFAGNNGDDTMAIIPGYTENDQRRRFSEHSYMVLESVCQLKRMIDNNVFDSVPGSGLKKLLDFKNNIVLFFTHLGRIYDNMVAATTFLNPKLTTEEESSLKAFYHKRYCVVHGKTLPIKFNENGKIEIPVISSSTINPEGWNIKTHME